MIAREDQYRKESHEGVLEDVPITPGRNGEVFLCLWQSLCHGFQREYHPNDPKRPIICRKYRSNDFEAPFVFRMQAFYAALSYLKFPSWAHRFSSRLTPRTPVDKHITSNQKSTTILTRRECPGMNGVEYALIADTFQRGSFRERV